MRTVNAKPLEWFPPHDKEVHDDTFLKWAYPIASRNINSMATASSSVNAANSFARACLENLPSFCCRNRHRRSSLLLGISNNVCTLPTKRSYDSKYFTSRGRSPTTVPSTPPHNNPAPLRRTLQDDR